MSGGSSAHLPLGECDLRCGQPAAFVVVGEAGDIYLCKQHHKLGTARVITEGDFHPINGSDDHNGDLCDCLNPGSHSDDSQATA